MHQNLIRVDAAQSGQAATVGEVLAAVPEIGR